MNIPLIIYGEKHSSTAEFYYRIGFMNHEMKLYKEAKDYLNKALSIQLKIDGEFDPIISLLYIYF